jgi:hypothetical protein
MTIPSTTPPQVWIVESRPDDDYDSVFEIDQAFDNEGAANEYAAQFLAPAETRVYALSLRSHAPNLITNYEFRSGAPTANVVPAREGGRSLSWDPKRVEPTVTQFLPEEIGERTLDSAVVRVRGAGIGAALVEAYGTDRDATRSLFLKTCADVATVWNADLASVYNNGKPVSA